jgi:hypothetical protein
VTFAYTATRPTIPPRPYLTVFLRNGSRTTNYIMALVDSGADYCIFPDDLAVNLGIDLTKGPRLPIYGITGKAIEARLAKVSLAVIGGRPKQSF